MTDERTRRLPSSARDDRYVDVAPAEHEVWTVEAHAADRRLRVYHFSGPEGAPALLFDPESGELLREQNWVRCDSVLLLTPSRIVARIGGQDGPPAQDIQGLPPLSGAWGNHELRHLDLSGASSLWISDGAEGGSAAAGCSVAVSGSARRPVFATEPLGGVTSDLGVPVYAGAPALAVDLAGTHPSSRRLLCFVNGSEHRTTLDTLPDGTTGFDLSPLIPEGTIAACELHLLGPLGSDLRGSFLVVPGLSIKRPEKVLDPADPVQISVAVAAPLTLSPSEVGPPTSSWPRARAASSLTSLTLPGTRRI